MIQPVQQIQQATAFAIANTPLNHGHEGPVVLILGGAAMLAVSLFLSLATQRRNPRPRGIRKTNHVPTSDPRLRSPETTTRDRRRRPKRRVASESAKPSKKPPGRDQRTWLPAVTRAAEKARLGTPLPLRTPRGRHGIQLTHCQTCLHGPQQTGCDREARILKDALRTVVPNGDVVELACNVGGPGSCRFEILVGGE